MKLFLGVVICEMHAFVAKRIPLFKNFLYKKNILKVLLLAHRALKF
jgi:hypothetical protein